MTRFKMSTGWVAIVVAFAFSLTTVLAQSSPQTQKANTPSTADATTVTAGEIANNPKNYIGKKVSVRAEVEDVLGRQMFLLDEDKLFAWPDVLVITPQLGTAITEDSVVTVTGTVQMFVETQFRRDYDWNWWSDMDPDINVTFRDRPVIVADSVKAADGTELVRR